MVMTRISCMECRQCNRKGKPSVTRLSKYCDEHYTKQTAKPSMFGFLTRIKDSLGFKRFDEKTSKLNTKGFRKDWFYR